MLEDYLKIASDRIRESALPGLKAKRTLLRQELKQETDIILKAKLAERILLITEFEDAAQRATYYGFSVIDPPSPPFLVPSLSSKGKPNIPVLIMLVLLASFLLSLLLAFCVQSTQRLKKQDPQRHEQIMQYLRYRTK